MTTAAKRARKKVNKLKGWPEPEAVETAEITQPVNEEPEPVTSESEHAAAVQALAKAKRMRNRKVA